MGKDAVRSAAPPLTSLSSAYNALDAGDALMPFPPSERVIFEINPLAEVVCQLSFPPSLRIAGEPPAEFQDRIRGAYPLLRNQPGGGIGGFGPGLGGVIQEGPGWRVRQGFNIGVGPQPAYVFTTEDGSRVVTLTPESLAVAETRYERWESLRAEIEALMGLLVELYQPPFFTRLGLRYQDLLDRRRLGLSNVPWKDLLNPGFAGALAGESPIAAEVTGIGTVVELSLSETPGARVRLQHGLNESPGDDGEIYAIDSDFFITERTAVADALSSLDGFNVQAGNLFRWAVSERLSAALKPQPISGQTAA
jgi:uncharacterized protein (TIGR04255 family)